MGLLMPLLPLLEPRVEVLKEAPTPVPPTETVGNCCERVIWICACCSAMR